jgi:hypothetical protein
MIDAACEEFRRFLQRAETMDEVMFRLGDVPAPPPKSLPRPHRNEP